MIYNVSLGLKEGGGGRPPAPSKSATEYHIFYWQPSKDIT